ncbi:MAG TPA: hypothetical protein VKV15_26995 [Bryobacteraceae bacterium]|nr:hypothetical protein [Bryobacteraceae bacterium]
MSNGVAVSQDRAPWYVWASVLAVTSAVIGVEWDISWHRSIGRDAFWTPAHVAIYACGVIAGICCGYLILATTFGALPGLRAASVKMWGFRGPLGAFISAWGGVAMLTSAPFDNWWHNAYGLDVKILSPPHMVLALGINSVILGALILVLGFFNRAESDHQGLLRGLLLYLGGSSLTMLMIVCLEYSSRTLMHSAIFYRTMAIAVPAVLVAVGRASGHRWGETIVASVYMAIVCGLIWVLPLFPAEPKLGPVYNKVTQFIPPPFPILLAIPALALDLLWPRVESWKKWTQAAVGGVVFLGTLLLVQWPFSQFLMTSAAANGFFGTIYHDYLTSPRSFESRNLFFAWEKTPTQFWEGMALALAIAISMMRIGLAGGDWMRRVRR